MRDRRSADMTLPDSITPSDREAALDEALAWASTPHWPPATLTGLATGGFRDIAGSLAECFKARGLELWAAGLDRWLAGQDDGGTDLFEPHLADLLAATGTRLAQLGCHPQLFAVVDDLWTLSGVIPNPVEELVALLEGAAETHPLLAQVASFLAESRYLTRLGARAGDALDWKATSRSLWPGPYAPPLGPRWPFVAAARIWPGPFLACLDASPPYVAHAAISAAVPWTRSAIEKLIALAPSAYAGDGEVQKRPAIFALLDEAPKTILRTTQSGGEDLEAATARLLDSVAARSDFAFLGRAWLQELNHEGGRNRHGCEDQSTVCEALLWLLAQRLPALPMPRALWIKQEEPLWQVDRLLAEVAIDLATNRRDCAAALLADGVAEGWVTSTGRDRALLTDSVEGKLIRATLGPLDDPVGWFDDVWLRIYDARERQSFSSRRTVDDIASVALAWAVAGLNGCEGSDPAPYWHRIVEAICEDHLSRSMAFLPDEPRDAVVRVAALIGCTLQKRALVSDDDLLRLLAVMAEPSERFARLAEVVLSAAGQDILEALMVRVGSATVIEFVTSALMHNEDRPAYSSLTAAQRAALQSWLAQRRQQ